MNIDKEKTDGFPSKTELYDYYITHNHSRKETSVFFNFSESTIGRLIKKYQIVKSHSDINRVKERNNLIKYGVKNVSQIEIIKAKKIQTFIQNYGVENPVQSVEIQKKIKDTNLMNYGVEHPAQNQQILSKMQSTCMERYGVKNPSEFNEFQQKRNNSNINKYGVKSTLSLEDTQQKIHTTLFNRYGVDWGCMTSECQNKNNGSNSRPNLSFKEMLEKSEIVFKREFTIDKYIYDFKIGNILVEIDPTYTHNSSIGYKNKIKPKNKNYHYKKTKTALDKGYKCIHIYDWNEYDEYIELIKNNNFTLVFRGIRGFWYNQKTRELIPQANNNELINQGFLLIYDDGYDIILQ